VTRSGRRITATHRHALVLTELRGPLLMGTPAADLAPGEEQHKVSLTNRAGPERVGILRFDSWLDRWGQDGRDAQRHAAGRPRLRRPSAATVPKAGQPAVVRSPRTATLSFTATTVPASGAAGSTLAASASASASGRREIQISGRSTAAIAR
jgi:hypothetical protein